MSRQSSRSIALRPARQTTVRLSFDVEALEERLVPAALNAYEVKAVEIINQLRANPAAFAEDLRQLYLGGTYQSPSGFAASDPIWTDLRARINSAESSTSWRSGFNSTGANTFMSMASALTARAPIVWDSGLQDGAIAHDQWMYTNVYAHSVFTQGAAPSIAESQSNPIPGISRNFNVSVGDWFNYTGLNAAGENISYAYNMSGATHQAYRNGQLTAAGYYQRLVYADVIGFMMEYSSGGSWGHLQNLGGNYNVIGISTLLYENPVETYKDGISQSYFSTHRLGLRPNANYANILIYQDLNSNNAYDIGEGLTGQVNYNFGQTTMTLPSTGYSSVQLPTSGTYTFSASYQGVSLGSQQITANATNKTIAFKVTQLATSVTLTATPQATTGGSLVTFTATVAQTGATGTIQFKDGGVNLGTPVALALVGGVPTAVLQISSLTDGSHSITAAYSGDSL